RPRCPSCPTSTRSSAAADSPAGQCLTTSGSSSRPSLGTSCPSEPLTQSGTEMTASSHDNPRRRPVCMHERAFAPSAALHKIYGLAACLLGHSRDCQWCEDLLITARPTRRYAWRFRNRPCWLMLTPNCVLSGYWRRVTAIGCYGAGIVRIVMVMAGPVLVPLLRPLGVSLDG